MRRRRCSSGTERHGWCEGGGKPAMRRAVRNKCALVFAALAGAPSVARATQAPDWPVRDPHMPGFVQATELPDGAVPSPGADGNFIIGPTHVRAPEMTPGPDVPRGAVYTFTMRSEQSRIYPGIARDAGTFGTPDPANPARL